MVIIEQRDVSDCLITILSPLAPLHELIFFLSNLEIPDRSYFISTMARKKKRDFKWICCCSVPLYTILFELTCDMQKFKANFTRIKNGKEIVLNYKVTNERQKKTKKKGTKKKPVKKNKTSGRETPRNKPTKRKK